MTTTIFAIIPIALLGVLVLMMTGVVPAPRLRKDVRTGLRVFAYACLAASVVLYITRR